MKTIGIDIGTTTISAVLLDVEIKKVIAVKTISNTAAIQSKNSFERGQDADKILDLTKKLLDEICPDAQMEEIGGIGVTGQMHGILYLDKAGNAVTPLYTWQDERGNLAYEGATYASFAQEKTGYQLASGFGGITHFYNTVNELIPKEATCLCTIPDFIAMKLSGRAKPLIHSSMAASLGLYNLKEKCFDASAGEALDLDMTFFPEIASAECCLGKTEQNIPVAIALGDNQASFLGTVRGGVTEFPQDSILLNVGTGSQISIYCKELGNVKAGEYRPYLKDSFLWVGSPLCGGYSYNLLERFFKETLQLFGVASTDNLYQEMDLAGKKLYDEKKEASLVVDTRFRGTRANPSISGSITNLTEDALHPQHLILGFMEGMAQELYDFYQEFSTEENSFALIGSGNGLRKNPLLCRICSDLFDKALALSELPEEAACGSALLVADVLQEELARSPIFFERNRVERVYDGGLLFSDFFGDEKKDGKFPEEWVASTVKALNKDSASDSLEGLSIVKGTDIPLNELISSYPQLVIGDREELGVLVKMLDSGIRLPMQAHPDIEFSRKYFDSEYGKVEMWLILDTREDACICFGFKDEVTKEQLAKVVEQSKTDKEAFEGYLNKVYVKSGDVFLVPAKAAHAIGYGCLLLEVQEPTDFTIQPEYWCGDYELNEQEMYLNLDKDVALDCFDYSICGEKAVALAKKQPRILANEEGVCSEELISYQDTPCFAVRRHRISGGEFVLPTGPSIYIVTKGDGTLEGRDYNKTLVKGDYFLLPYVAGGQFVAKSEEDMELIECLPPQTSKKS